MLVLNDVSLAASGGPATAPFEVIDPVIAWIVYLAALAISCTALWFLNRPPVRETPTPRRRVRELDEAA